MRRSLEGDHFVPGVNLGELLCKRLGLSPQPVSLLSISSIGGIPLWAWYKGEYCRSSARASSSRTWRRNNRYEQRSRRRIGHHRGKVVDPVEGNHTGQRCVLSRDLRHHVPARGLSNEDDSRGIDVEASVFGTNELDCLTQILELIARVDSGVSR